VQRILLFGAGKIGLPAARLLAGCGDYRVVLADRLAFPGDLPADQGLRRLRLDASDAGQVRTCLEQEQIQAVVSALPYHCSLPLARLARENACHYFDLTEDLAVSVQIRRLAAGARQALVPHCGLAPGFVSIAAAALMAQFETVDAVKMRVGALPLHPSNALGYSLTWSTDGLINEYGNPCQAIEEGEEVVLQPLEGLETITLDGDEYEAFNTSGGLGTLVESCRGRVRSMNYKTMRYPGHCEKVRLLMNDLRLNQDRATLKRILENAIPATRQDVVLIYVSVTGRRLGALFEETYVQKIYPRQVAGQRLSAIQLATAVGLCATIDLVLQQPGRHQGFVTQESLPLQRFLENRFGRYYRQETALLDETVTRLPPRAAPAGG